MNLNAVQELGSQHVRIPACVQMQASKVLVAKTTQGLGLPLRLAKHNSDQFCRSSRTKLQVLAAWRDGQDPGLTVDRVKDRLKKQIKPEGPGDGNTTAYTALGLIQAALAVPALLTPHAAAEFLFGAAAQPYSSLQDALVRILGAGLLAGATTALALKRKAETKDLNDDYSLTLNFGLALFAGSGVAAQLAHKAVLTVGSAAIGAAYKVAGAALLPALLVSLYHYGRSSGKGLNPFPILSKTVTDVLSLPRNSSLQGTAYSLLAAVFLAAGASYILVPTLSLTAVFGQTGGEEVVLLWKAIGAGLLLLTTWAYVLKDGANKGDLGDPFHKLLNGGLTAAALTHLLVLTPMLSRGEAGPLMPYLLGAWTTALATATAGLLTDE